MFEYKTHLQDDTPYLRGQPLCKRFSVLRLVGTAEESEAQALVDCLEARDYSADEYASRLQWQGGDEE